MGKMVAFRVDGRAERAHKHTPASLHQQPCKQYVSYKSSNARNLERIQKHRVKERNNASSTDQRSISHRQAEDGGQKQMSDVLEVVMGLAVTRLQSMLSNLWNSSWSVYRGFAGGTLYISGSESGLQFNLVFKIYKIVKGNKVNKYSLDTDPYVWV